MASSKSFSNLTAPYNRLPNMTIKVICVKEVVKVTVWEFTGEGVVPAKQHKNVVAAITDGKSVMKFTLFEDLAKQISVGKCYIVKNYGLSKYGTGQRTMLSRKNTALYFCAPIEVSSDLESQGIELISPASTSVAIKDLQADIAKWITVEGSIISMEPVQRYCGERGEALPMRTITIKDGEAEVRVVLWREALIQRLSVGVPVKISHLRPRRSSFGIELQSSGLTEVEVVAGLKEIIIKGIRVVPDGIEILDDTDTECFIMAGVWGKTFPEDTIPLPEKISVMYDDGKVAEVFLPEA